MPDCSEDHIVLNIYNTQMTKADDDTATEYERQLNRLDCFFYVRGKTTEPCVYYQMVELDAVGQSTVSFYVNETVLKEIIPAGQVCDVFVIANYPDAPAFAAKQQGTDVPTLGQKVLDMSENKYDGVDKPFVMTGLGVAVKGRNSNATADISLRRVASKVTMTVKVPKSITEKGLNWSPSIIDNQGNVTVRSSFRHGTGKSYLYGSDYEEVEASHIITEKVNYTYVSETEDEYVLKCSIPFYSYSRSWPKGSDHSAYLTLEMPWGVDENNDKIAETDIRTYYYQILVNSTGRCFERNRWYDMTVRVSILGNTVESVPQQLEQLSYYVLDWTEETSNGALGSGDRREEVEIQKYNYLEVPQKYIEMNNVSEIDINYTASHKIGIKFNTSGGKKVEALGESTTALSAFYINNGSGTPVATQLDGIVLKDPDVADANETTVKSQFSDNDKGILTFKYDLSKYKEKIYSPAYVFITIWLDLNGDGIHDTDEVLTEDVTIVMYPSIYIIGEESQLYSVFVNGNYNSGRINTNDGLNNMGYLYINNQQVGKATGYDTSRYMHVITVSAFSESNYKFAYNNSGNKDTQYIIGDPRERKPNKLEVGNGGTGWVSAKDINGTERYLVNYYPTSTEDNAYQVIAPKFRISSKLAGYSHSTPKGAAYRCASYQEAGYPAGRWRLPTTAEVLFVIELQKEKKIVELFHGSQTTTYLSATDRITNSNENFNLQFGYGNISTGSVRCVYDEWYWGSEKEAIENKTNFANYGGYEFTWGDEPIY